MNILDVKKGRRHQVYFLYPALSLVNSFCHVVCPSVCLLSIVLSHDN